MKTYTMEVNYRQGLTRYEIDEVNRGAKIPKYESSRDLGMGVEFCREVNPDAIPTDGAKLAISHTYLKTYTTQAESLDRALENCFRDMQGENWSPNGEACDQIQSLGLNHTSMSVGDAVLIDSVIYLVDNLGFTRVGEIVPEPQQSEYHQAVRDAAEEDAIAEVASELPEEITMKITAVKAKKMKNGWRYIAVTPDGDKVIRKLATAAYPRAYRYSVQICGGNKTGLALVFSFGKNPSSGYSPDDGRFVTYDIEWPDGKTYATILDEMDVERQKNIDDYNSRKAAEEAAV